MMDMGSWLPASIKKAWYIQIERQTTHIQWSIVANASFENFEPFLKQYKLHDM